MGVGARKFAVKNVILRPKFVVIFVAACYTYASKEAWLVNLPLYAIGQIAKI